MDNPCKDCVGKEKDWCDTTKCPAWAYYIMRSKEKEDVDNEV